MQYFTIPSKKQYNFIKLKPLRSGFIFRHLFCSKSTCLFYYISSKGIKSKLLSVSIVYLIVLFEIMSENISSDHISLLFIIKDLNNYRWEDKLSESVLMKSSKENRDKGCQDIQSIWISPFMLPYLEEKMGWGAIQIIHDTFLN